MRFFLLFSQVVWLTAAASSLRIREDESCDVAHDETSCFQTKDATGQPCVWCECSAVPSECLTQEQSKQVPPGVFTCKSPSSRLERMTLQEQLVDDTFCDVKSKSGYIALDKSEYDQNGEDKHLFYWMFEKRNQSDGDDETIPLIVWLTGGPGCSSSLALLTENGPCSVNEDGETTSLNPYSWTEAAHVLWLDQPAGVGFSYGSETDTNEEMISEDAYWFLQKFFQEHPEYLSSPLFIVGESYGGHYVPSIAHKVHTYNKKNNDLPKLNLKGVAIGNGLTAPEVQYPYYPEMAYNNSHGIKVIGETEYETMKKVVPKCTALIHQCNKGDGPLSSFACQSAFLVCNAGLTSPYQATGLNPYDIRKKCEVPPLCYDFSYIAKFMNSEKTKAALGVDPNRSHNWESCNFGINMKFHTDWMKDFSKYITELLNDDIPALIYAGDVDFICNYLGNQAWTYELNWKGGKEFQSAEPHDWHDNGGLARSSGGLTFLQVYDGGHMVPADQPKVALDMITDFVNQKEF